MMSCYDENYCQNHDIDYFFVINGLMHHIASNGSILPPFIDRETNYDIQRRIYERINQVQYSHAEIIVDEDAIKRILYNEGYDLEDITNEVVADYAQSFVDFARLGFISCDTIDERLIIIASPIVGSGGLSSLDANIPACERTALYEFGFDDEHYLRLP